MNKRAILTIWPGTTTSNKEGKMSFEPTYEELKHSNPPLISMFLYFVLSLPMRNWNVAKAFRATSPSNVLSLPMRNWNPLYWMGRILLIRSFEPTYEELKLGYFLYFFPSHHLFWAYLWGIETSFWPFYRWPKLFVLSLPMRNWNFQFFVYLYSPLSCFEPTYEELKHIFTPRIQI